MKLRAVIERITYQNGENDYSMLKARVKGYYDLVTIVGNMLDVTVGSVLVVDWPVESQPAAVAIQQCGGSHPRVWR